MTSFKSAKYWLYFQMLYLSTVLSTLIFFNQYVHASLPKSAASVCMTLVAVSNAKSLAEYFTTNDRIISFKKISA